MAFDLQINEFIATQESMDKKVLSVEEVAIGFITVANETMCRPIRALTTVSILCIIL